MTGPQWRQYPARSSHPKVHSELGFGSVQAKVDGLLLILTIHHTDSQPKGSFMTLRVTFDTNALDYACRPERYPKDPRQPQLANVRDALRSGAIQGFFSVTMLTIEGIMNKDRAGVYESTTLTTVRETPNTTKNADLPDAIRSFAGDGDLETHTIKLTVNQPARQEVHPEVKARVAAAHGLGVRVLKAVPRVGAYRIDDPDRTFYLDNGADEDLARWIDKAHEVSRAIEAKGLGMAQLKKLGLGLATGDPQGTWFNALTKAKDIHEQRKIERAFAEWADADSIASHIAYGISVFCSNDVGNSNATNSILDVENRTWLTQTYGVQFMTFDDLLAAL